MNFHKYRGIVINKGKEAPMKKNIPEEDIWGLQVLRIDKDDMCEDERPNKMSEQMIQDLSHESKSFIKNDFRLKQEGVIVGKTDGQTRGPPNFKQPTLDNIQPK